MIINKIRKNLKVALENTIYNRDYKLIETYIVGRNIESAYEVMKSIYMKEYKKPLGDRIGTYSRLKSVANQLEAYYEQTIYESSTEEFDE